eukprot:10160154-Karenia_brevis.AAC.1
MRQLQGLGYIPFQTHAGVAAHEDTSLVIAVLLAVSDRITDSCSYPATSTQQLARSHRENGVVPTAGTHREKADAVLYHLLPLLEAPS